MDITKQHLELLGKTGQDKISKMEGVISAVSFDLYGSIQAVITPKTDKDGNFQCGTWFDIRRLKILDESRVMDLPDFEKGYIAEGRKGAAEKPIL